MDEYIRLKRSNCKNCYKCIRNCPVKSISFKNQQANIVPEECILCGRCFVACPQNAKEVRNDLPAAKTILAAGGNVYVSLAPSFVACWEGVSIASMEKALKLLGFAGVEETAVGATIVKEEYARIVGTHKQEAIISSCCHSVNTLIQKHYPEALPYLAKVLSPMQAHCKDLKRRYPGARCIFIGPCISKKAEAEDYPGIVDCALTFEELSAWLEETGIRLEPHTDGNQESRARLFPTTGGILRTMAEKDPEYAYLAVDGIENCITAIEDVAAGKMGNCFIEMSACPGSCIGGPAMGKNRRASVRDYVAVDRYAGKRDFPVEQPEPEKLQKRFPMLGIGQVKPGAAAIEEILHQMGKTRPEHELNCGSCGYDTCRDKAAAVIAGKADINMCLPYLEGKAASISDQIICNSPNGIIGLGGDFKIQRINNAACRLLSIPDRLAMTGADISDLLDTQPFFEAYELGTTVRHTVYLERYDRWVDQLTTYDKGHDLYLCILRDVTDEEKGRTERESVSRTTIEITDKIIEKQMRTVQEIASLLGETTAETKVALTKLKESLGHE